MIIVIHSASETQCQIVEQQVYFMANVSIIHISINWCIWTKKFSYKLLHKKNEIDMNDSE